MKKIYLLAIVFVATMAVAVSVNAAWLIDQRQVTTCSDTDGGLVYNVQGQVTVTLPGFTGTFTDYCISSTSVGEYACSHDIPGEPSGWAVHVGEDCGLVNGTSCVSGRCV